MERDDDDKAGPPTSPTGPAASAAAAAISVAADAARAGWEAENRAAAHRLSAAHQLMTACLDYPGCGTDPDDPRPGYSILDAADVAITHLVRVLAISTYKAGTMISFAADLHLRYPAILTAMTQGRLEEATAKALAGQMEFVDPALLHQIQQDVVDDYLAAIEAGRRPGMKAIRNRADEIISTRDPNAVRARKKDAGRDRGASISPGRDGMSTLHALLHADEAAVLAEALEQKVAADRAIEEDTAATASEPATGPSTANGPDTDTDTDTSPGSADAPYSLAQRRADALMSLICGDTTTPTRADSGATDSDDTTNPAAPGTSRGSGTPDTSGSGTPDGPAAGGVMLRPKITVIAPTGANANRWADHTRVEFARTGEAALQSLLDMLACSDGASLHHIDPTPGAADDPHAALRYRPSAALAKQIRLRDGTCRHPGCTVPADACDLDHVVPFNHADPTQGGQTVESNMACLCRRHHRFKTFNDWHYQLDPDGTLIITTDQGHTMVTHPDGPLADYRREQARVETAAWEKQQRRNPDPGRAAATGGANPTGRATKTSWARRDARKHTHRDTQRSHNATNRQAARQDAATQARHQARNTARATALAKAGATFQPITVTIEPRTIIDLPAHRHSRWWNRNHHRYHPPGNSALENQLKTIIDNLTDPPPF